MPLHLVAFDSSIANGAVFLQVNAVPDVFTNIQSNNVVIADLNHILGAAHFGATANRSQLRSPTLQQVFNSDIVPVRRSALATNVNPNWVDFTNMGVDDNSLILKASEQLSVYAIQGAAGAEREYIAVLLGDKLPTPVKGQIFTVRFTGTTTLTADTWTQVPLTAEQNLQVGTYTVVGMRAKSATGVFARIGTPGFPYRPGCLVGSDDMFADPPLFRYGNLGAWFSFKNTQVLTADFLATAGDTSEVVELDVMFAPGQ